MLNLKDVVPFASTSIFPTFTRPVNSSAIASTVGASARQGAHHAAQKSIRTGTGDFRTSVSKLESVISTVLAPMVPSCLNDQHPKVSDVLADCQSQIRRARQQD